MNLTLVKKDGQHWIDSRQVAEMVDKDHAHLCRDIRGYIGDLEKPTNPNMDWLDFFKESAYKDRKGETRPCYLISRKGCDFIGNKWIINHQLLLLWAARVEKRLWPDHLKGAC